MPTQGIGLRPQPWARISRPVGPAVGSIDQRRNETTAPYQLPLAPPPEELPPLNPLELELPELELPELELKLEDEEPDELEKRLCDDELEEDDE